MLKKVREPISEHEARLRFEQGPWFTVVSLSEPSSPAPDFAIELLPQFEFARVIFYTDAGSIARIHDFEPHDGQLFMVSSTTYTYPDDSYYGQSKANVVVTIMYSPDGKATLTKDDVSNPQVTQETRTDVDVSANWEPIPEFGDWDGLARCDRWRE